MIPEYMECAKDITAIPGNVDQMLLLIMKRPFLSVR